MPFKTWATNDVPTAADFNAMFADAVSGNVATEENTTSASYGDLTTVGPSAAITLVTGQQARVDISSMMINQTVGGGALATFTTTGVTASDTNAAWTRSTERTMATRQTYFVAGSSGTFTSTMKYKVEVNGTAYFASRRITVMKR